MAQQVAYSRVIATAHRDLLTVHEMDNKVVLCICPDLFDVLQIYNCRSMDTKEHLRVEALLH